MDDDQLKEVYQMVDNIPFSRAKKNIMRDFSDGVMMAELIHYYRPKVVEPRSYPAVNSTVKKINNWTTLNNKVLKRLGLALSKEQIEQIVNSTPMAIENYLYRVFLKFESPELEHNTRSQLLLPQASSFSKPNNKKQQFQPAPVIKINSSKQMPVKEFKGPKILLDPADETDEILQLVNEIEEAYAYLIKLQQKSKLKDEMLRNLEKKIEKLIYS